MHGVEPMLCIAFVRHDGKCSLASPRVQLRHTSMSAKLISKIYGGYNRLITAPVRIKHS